MVNPGQMKIGNENFKNWLKRLDPISRVEKMSAIARIQAMAGLRGSLIKASLAQLSQRCHVMLIRLTKKEINRYTRRKPAKKVVDTNACNRKLDRRKKSTLKFSRLQTNSHEHAPRKEKMNCIENKSNIACIPHNIVKQKTYLDEKLKEKYKELFGDDTIDANSIENDREKNCNKNICDGKIKNYLSTTVNVNIYSSVADSTLKSNNAVTKRKSCSENKIGFISSSNKHLKIDVSLSNNTVGNQNQDKPNKLKINSDASRKTKVKNTKLSKVILGPQKSHLMSAVPFLNSDSNSNEEDTVKELWKIFGMDSPTDRSESIIRSYPQSSKESSTSSTTSENQALTVSLIEEHCKNSLSNSKTHMELSNDSECTDVDLVQSQRNIDFSKDNSASKEKYAEPLCKIAQTFSLNEQLLPTSSEKKSTIAYHNDNQQDTTSGASFLKNSIFINQANNLVSSSVTETILLSDDEEEHTFETSSRNIIKLQENYCASNENKVGKIRVKSLTSLLDPSRSVEIPKTIDIPASSSQGENSRPTPLPSANNNIRTVGKSVEECFFTIYSYYCDELLESKASKLGEILHLAISDDYRRRERIRRADQLPPCESVNQEKQRAIKDFNDMMKLRANEFGPLFQTIVNKFEQSSKVTLIIALFIRIFMHAQKIDPKNGDQILAARSVVHAMLSKHNPVDTDITNVLNSDPKNFLGQVEMVNTLLESYYKGKSKSFENTILTASFLQTTSTESFANSSSQVKNNDNTNPTIRLTSSAQNPLHLPQQPIVPSAPVSQESFSPAKVILQIPQPGKNLPLKTLKRGPPNVTIGPNFASAQHLPPPNSAVSPSHMWSPSQTLNTQLCLSMNRAPPYYMASKISTLQTIQNSAQNSCSTLDQVCFNPVPISNLETQPRISENISPQTQLVDRNEINSSLTQKALFGLASERRHSDPVLEQRRLIVNKLGTQPNHVNMSKRSPPPPYRCAALALNSLATSSLSATRCAAQNTNYGNIQSVTPNMRKTLSSTPNSEVPTTPSRFVQDNTPISSSDARFLSHLRNVLTKTANSGFHASDPRRTTNYGFQTVNSKKSHEPHTKSTGHTNAGQPHKTATQVHVLGSNQECLNQQTSTPVVDTPKEIIANNPILAHRLNATLSRTTSLPAYLKDTRLEPVLKTATLGEESVTSNSFFIQRPVESQPYSKTAPTVSVTSAISLANRDVTTAEVDSPNVSSPNVLQTTAESLQMHVPSSSHCHPFIRRMPISGKMKMFFGNKN